MSKRVHLPGGTFFGTHTFASLRQHYNYRLYFSGQFLSQIGTWLQSAAMAWLVLELTHSAIAVGVLTFCQFGPYLVLGLFGGALSDRLDHRMILIVTQVALALCSAIMAILTLLQVVTVWEAFFIAAMHGDAQIYGLLTACFGAGAFIGALIAASFGRATWPILLASAFGFGASEVIMAFQNTVIGAVFFLLITGTFYTMYTSNTNTIVQLAAPGNLQGRVAGLYSYIFAGSNAPGSLIAGALADIGGTQLAFLVGGSTALASAAFGITRLWLKRNKDQQKGSLVEKPDPSFDFTDRE